MAVLIESLGYPSQKAFADAVGIGVDAVNAWVNNRHRPGRSQQVKIAQLAGVAPSRMFAFLERGDELGNSQNPDNRGNGTSATGVMPSRPGLMPHFNRVPAAWGSETTDMGYPVGEADAWIPNLSGYADAFSATAQGDSMEPLIHDGERITCSPSAEINDGSIVYVRLDGSRDDENCIRQVFRQSDEAVLLVPMNKRYEPRRVAAEQIIRMVRVVEVSRAL